MNMQMMMQQARKLQQQMAAGKKELAETEIIGEAGGGLVSITLTGDKKVVAVSIKPEAVDPDDVEMLEDLISASLGDALKKADELEKRLVPSMGM